MLYNKLNHPLFIAFYLLSLFGGTNFLTIEIFDYQLFLGRLLTFILPFLIVKKENIKALYAEKNGKMLLLVAFSILIWSALSFYWADDKKAVMVNTFYVLSGLLNGIIVISFGFDSNFKIRNNFLQGWFIAWIAIVLFAYIEILFNFHIEGNFSKFLQEQTPGVAAFDFVVSIIGGPNELAIFLALSLPLLFLLFNTKPYYFLIILLVSLQLIYRNDAKFILIAYILFVISLILVHKRKLLNQFYPTIAAYFNHILFVLFFIAIVLLNNKLIKNNYERYSIYESFESNIHGLQVVQNQNTSYVNAQQGDSLNTKSYENANKDSIKLLNKKANADESLTSFAIRYNLILNGFKFIKEHPLLGIGIGNFEYHMKNDKDLIPTMKIVNSHSWPIQIISEHGIIVGGFYWLTLLYLLIINFKYLYLNPESDIQKFVAVNMLVIFVIISNASSSFASSPFNWMMLCFLFVAFNYRKGHNAPNG